MSHRLLFANHMFFLHVDGGHSVVWRSSHKDRAATAPRVSSGGAVGARSSWEERPHDGVSLFNKKEKHMARKQQLMAHRPSPTKVTRSGLEKMRMNNERIHREIKRILTERAKREATGKPHHREPHRSS